MKWQSQPPEEVQPQRVRKKVRKSWGGVGEGGLPRWIQETQVSLSSFSQTHCAHVSLRDTVKIRILIQPGQGGTGESQHLWQRASPGGAFAGDPGPH
jgi:hypothetical protein